jgi:glucokinase
VQAVVVDQEHRPLGTARDATPADGGPPAIAEAMTQALGEAARDAGVELSHLAGRRRVLAGDGRRGDRRRHQRGEPQRLGGVSFPLADELGRRLGTTVRVGNDVNMATLGEFRLGAAKPFDSVLGVFWGTGVGGGLILDGKPWTGPRRAPARSGTRWSSATGADARAATAAAWRPTRAAAPWSEPRARPTGTAARRACSSSWRSAAATA